MRILHQQGLLQPIGLLSPPCHQNQWEINPAGEAHTSAGGQRLISQAQELKERAPLPESNIFMEEPFVQIICSPSESNEFGLCTQDNRVHDICETSIYWEALAVRNYIQIPNQRIKCVATIASWSAYPKLLPPVTCPLTQFMKIKQEAKQITSKNKKRKVKVKTGSNQTKKHINSFCAFSSWLCVFWLFDVFHVGFQVLLLPFFQVFQQWEKPPPSGNYMAFHLLQLLVSTLSKA